MLPCLSNRVAVSIRPNNQLTLTYGNYRDFSDFYKSRLCVEAGFGDREKKKILEKATKDKLKNQPKYTWKDGVFGVHNLAKKSISVLPCHNRKISTPASACMLNKPKSFTSASGQKLRECGSAIDQICKNPENTVAITLTLPSHHDDAFRAIAAYSGYAVNRLFQPIRRHYGDDVLWFFVWEYQKRGALHLHIALYHSDKDKALEIGNSFRSQWHKILQDISNLANTNLFLGRNGRDNSDIEKNHFYCQPMRRSLGAYFSKYAGKKESKQAWYCQKYPVSRFWGCCYALKRLIKSLSLEVKIESPDSELIESVIASILKKIESLSLSISNQYDFDIERERDGSSLKIAVGTRVTFYCEPRQLQKLLSEFSEYSQNF